MAMRIMPILPHITTASLLRNFTTKERRRRIFKLAAKRKVAVSYYDDAGISLPSRRQSGSGRDTCRFGIMAPYDDAYFRGGIPPTSTG